MALNTPEGCNIGSGASFQQEKGRLDAQRATLGPALMGSLMTGLGKKDAECTPQTATLAVGGACILEVSL